MPIILGCESCRKEEAVQRPTEDKSETPVTEEKKKKQKGRDRFVNFLMMGGFLVILFAIVGIVIAISILTRDC